MTGRLLDMALGGLMFAIVPALSQIAACCRGRAGGTASQRLLLEKAVLTEPVRHAPAKERRRASTFAAPHAGRAQQPQEGPAPTSPSRVHGRPSRPQPTSR